MTLKHLQVNLKVIAVIALLFLSITVYAQDAKKNVETTFLAYMQTMRNKDFNKAMDYIPEQFFEIVKKDQMIKLFTTTFNNPDMEFKIGDAKISEIKDINKIENKFYTILRYTSQIAMRFKPTKTDETAEEMKARNNLIKLSLQNTFGIDNVKLEEETNWFNIVAVKSACGISLDGKANWKFIEMENKQRLIIDKILPKAITAQL